MRKMIFSAIALTAFSFAGMASNESNKNGEPVKKLEETKKEVVVTQKVETPALHPCVYVGFAIGDAVEENGGTPAQITSAALTAYKLCMIFWP
jgi:hypothetical protein